MAHLRPPIIIGTSIISFNSGIIFPRRLDAFKFGFLRMCCMIQLKSFSLCKEFIISVGLEMAVHSQACDELYSSAMLRDPKCEYYSVSMTLNFKV